MKQIAIIIFLCAFTMTTGAFAEMPNPLRKPVVSGTTQGTLSLFPADRCGTCSPMSTKDADRYVLIFDLQERGEWDAADAEIPRLSDDRLMGHVLHQRYMHPTAWVSTYTELESWLKDYSDHPGAGSIYKLAIKRRPKGAASPMRPTSRPMISGAVENYGFVERSYRSSKRRSTAEERRVNELKSTIAGYLRRTMPTRSIQLLNSTKTTRWMDAVEIDEIKADIATSYYLAGKPDKAIKVGAPAADRSGHLVPKAHWFVALAAWRLDDLELAGKHFAAAYDAPDSSPWLSTAAAYWSGRVALRNCDPKGHIAWLKRAAHYSGTFYGLLAARTLGVKADFNWRLPELGPEHMTALCRHPAGVRALALMETGRWDRIESELMLIRPGNNIRLRDALLALSETLRLPAAALRLGSLIAPCTNGARFDAALYPIPPWRPEGGYTVDEALVFALMRQESRFDTEARNPSGASGLMQLMPATAHWVAGDKSAHGDALFDPAVNIGLGQRYIEMMLKYPAIDGNLLKLAVAYNGGPGNLNRWMREMDTGNDPLLFLESIPAAETRAFAAHVLANYWIYRLRLGRDTPSLTRIASGDWPLYPYHATVQVQMAEDDRQLK